MTLPAYPPSCVAFSPESDRVAFHTLGGGIEIADLKGNVLFRDETSLSTCPTAFSPDGQYLAVGTQYGAELLSADKGKLIASLYLFGGEKELDWVVATPDGLFDGTPAAWKQLGGDYRTTPSTSPRWRFSSGISIVRACWRNFLWNRTGCPEDVADIDTRQPLVHFTSVPGGNEPLGTRLVHLKIAVSQAPADTEHRGKSGVRDLRLFRNGTLVKSWRGDLPLEKNGTAEFEADTPIVAGDNVFTAYAFSGADIKSTDATLNLKGDRSLQRKGTAYVIAMGIDRYAAASEKYPLNLKYAEADAADFAEQFRKSQINLEQFANIRVIPLIGEDATRANLKSVLRVLSGQASKTDAPDKQRLLAGADAVKPEDGVFFFYAGHGAASDGHFYLIPQNYDPNYEFDKPESHTISELDLSRMLEGISPARSFLIIDACQSGQAIESDRPVGPVDAPGLAQLAYEKGLYILAASAASEPALETQKLGGGHGFLTYSLVEEGLKTSAATLNGTVELRQWFAYASRRVPELETADMARRGFKLRNSRQRDVRQHPRLFYRREPEIQPFIVAKPVVSSEPQVASGRE